MLIHHIPNTPNLSLELLPLTGIQDLISNDDADIRRKLFSVLIKSLAGSIFSTPARYTAANGDGYLGTFAISYDPFLKIYVVPRFAVFPRPILCHRTVQLLERYVKILYLIFRILTYL